MSYTVENIMELTGMTNEKLAIEYIKDAFKEMALAEGTKPLVAKRNIIDGKISYPLPSDVVSIEKVSVLYQSGESELIADDADRLFNAASNWTNNDLSSYNESGSLSIENDSADQSCYLDVASQITVGRKYRLECDCTITSGTFELQQYTTSDKLGSFATGNPHVIEFTALATDRLKISGTASSGEATFDNFSLVEMEQHEYHGIPKIIGSMRNQFYDEET